MNVRRQGWKPSYRRRMTNFSARYVDGDIIHLPNRSSFRCVVQKVLNRSSKTCMVSSFIQASSSSSSSSRNPRKRRYEEKTSTSNAEMHSSTLCVTCIATKQIRRKKRRSQGRESKRFERTRKEQLVFFRFFRDATQSNVSSITSIGYEMDTFHVIFSMSIVREVDVTCNHRIEDDLGTCPRHLWIQKKPSWRKRLWK